MKIKYYFLFIFYTLFFLFYPGDSLYFNIFAYNRNLFNQKTTKPNLIQNPLPYLKSTFLPEISAEGVYVVDLPSFTPLLQRNSQIRLLPASTTKILTALVTVDIFKTDDVVTVKRILEDGQAMGLVPGERITVENLLYGILVHSGNDAAYALADSFGYDQFVELLNKKAKQLKMDDSLFKNPAGLDDFNQYTTPFDLALAARALLNDNELKKIVATKEIIIADVDFKYFHKLSNVNKLLGEVQGIGGLKTGYTENAGENLVSFYKNKDHQFIIVILKSKDRFADTKNVVQWLQENIDYIQ